RVGGIDGHHLPAAQLAAHGEPGRQLADLLDHDLRARRAIPTQAEAEPDHVRVRTGLDQQATAAAPAGVAGHTIAAQQALHETLREGAFAQTWRTAQQQ